MFFLDLNGTLQEGTPLTDSEKKTLDQMVHYFHNSPSVCAGYHPTYDPKCLKLAVELRKRFAIQSIPDFEYREVDEPAEEVQPSVVPPSPPEPIPEPILSDNDYPF